MEDVDWGIGYELFCIEALKGACIYCYIYCGSSFLFKGRLAKPCLFSGAYCLGVDCCVFSL